MKTSSSSPGSEPHLRIAVIGNSAESMLNFRGSLIRRMLGRGHTVIAFAPDYDGVTRAAITASGAVPEDFPLARSSVNPVTDLKTVFALRASFTRLRPDVTLSYFVKPAIYGTFAALFAGVRRRVVMLEGLGYGFADGARSVRHRFVSSAVRKLLRLALSRTTVTLVLNEEDRHALVEEVGLDENLVENMGGIGVQITDFSPSPLHDPPTTFAMAARLIAEKGVLDYVEAAKRVRQSNPNARFLLLGGIDQNPGSLSAAQVHEWVAAGIIEWPGRVDDIQEWLRRSDIFVLPSYYREGVPRSIQEAMALGRPIITTDHVGCRDTVDHGVNGLLVPVRDVASLTSAMRQLLEVPGLAERMGIESRRIAEERFDAARADAHVVRWIEGG